MNSEEKPQIIWMHCASLGEFEQGRPVLEQLRTAYPRHKILLTFFSPSGYEIRKDYKGADLVCYLPPDGARNAKRFMQLVKPALVIFVKYEFWYYYLKQVKQDGVPLLLIAALFRENSAFFRWYGTLQRKMLSFFDHIFVQDVRSRDLLATIKIQNVSVSGDTRFDRVTQIAENSGPIPLIESFTHAHPVIVAGSTWPPDEVMLARVLKLINDPKLKLIIAPHEIEPAHITSIEKLFPDSVKWSAIKRPDNTDVDDAVPQPRVLIIDNIGMLSQLYQYATITYIGGGFGKGIHNTLEAAVWGKPVVFGPVYHKFREAEDLVKKGGAMPVTDEAVCLSVFQKLLNDPAVYDNCCENARKYVWDNRGATGSIMAYIQENRLLTN